jgi:predicted nuclease of restriction endonuclease-like (RecB) superfamily
MWNLLEIQLNLSPTNKLIEKKVGLISLNDPIDTSTAQGRMVFGIFATLAEFERELIRERTQAGLNLQRMRQFATHFPDITIMPQSVAQLPWGHISLLIHKVKNQQELLWYAEQVVEQGWPRITLERYVKDGLFQRQAVDSVKASNFLARLPNPQSKLAHELLKQPYNFDFLGLHDEAHEREIEHASIEHITNN